mmetsp:Transcript_72784/g.151981  ORF Transcript_72784/g.151981 Transcript_72784/m.151981 type:complete len:427 (-) Transcript_72784:303-1583(-)
MIHLFSGCKEICHLPGRACRACGEICEHVECSCCKEWCDELSHLFSDFVSKPLGLYVVLGVGLSAAEIAFCCLSLAQTETLEKCQLKEGMPHKVGVNRWLYGQMGTAWLNLVFAPYLQLRLSQNMKAMAAAQAETGEWTTLSKTQVKKAFSDIFWHDFGFCAYVFVLIGSCIWSYWGLDWVQAGPACDPDGFASLAGYMGLGFFFFIIVHFFFWNIYLECMSTVEVRAGQHGLPAAAFSAAASAAAHHYLPVGGAGGAHQAKGPVKAGAPSAAAAAAPASAPFAPSSHAGDPHAHAHAHAHPAADGKKRGTVGSAAHRARQPRQLAKLGACLVLDGFGSATYAVPGLGESADIAYAPSQGAALMALFDSKAAAFVGFLEEILPFTDAIPSATISWILDCFGVFDPPEAADPLPAAGGAHGHGPGRA